VKPRDALLPKQSWLFDALIVLAVLALALLPISGYGYWWALHGALMALVLLGRRQWPVTVFGVVAALAAIQLLYPKYPAVYLPYDVAVLIAMYGVVKYAHRLAYGVAAGGVGLLGGVLIGITMAAHGHKPSGDAPIMVGMVTLSVVAVWLLGLAMRTRRLYVASLEERAVTAERERDQQARIAVVEERARIARELHDIVAHSLSVMILHADGAAYALEQAPERARAAMRTVSTTGRDALGEMRQLVHVLRGTEGTAAPDGATVDRPRDGLKQVYDAVERARTAGLDVRAAVRGTAPPVPEGVELAAYRIVQEALTNALKHAGHGALAALTITYAPHLIRISLEDDGGGQVAPAGLANGGHGLVGMRERVALYGGTVDAGPRLGGGWFVHAEIPLQFEAAGRTES
jgi:signal transduction histidine kinase